MVQQGIGFLQLIERSGGQITNGSLSRWLNNKSQPTADKLVVISKILSIPVWYLFYTPAEVDKQQTEEQVTLLKEKITKLTIENDKLKKQIKGYRKAIQELSKPIFIEGKTVSKTKV